MSFAGVGRATGPVVTALLLIAPAAGAAPAASTSVDRIALTGNASTLPGTSGGTGGSLSWLHNFDADSLLTIGAERQQLYHAHWAFGSLTGSLSRNMGDGRYTYYGEAHEGAGEDGPHALHYRIEAAGVNATYFHQLSLQLEYKRIDVETTHGNLPKIGLSYLWTRHWMTSVSLADSAGGNLGTHLESARVDRYSPAVNLFAGGSYGRVSPTIFDLGVPSPGHLLREEYLGASKTFARRTEVSLTADFMNLSGSKRKSVTLGFIFRLGSLGAAH
jgi:hypothetical protein